MLSPVFNKMDHRGSPQENIMPLLKDGGGNGDQL